MRRGARRVRNDGEGVVDATALAHVSPGPMSFFFLVQCTLNIAFSLPIQFFFSLL